MCNHHDHNNNKNNHQLRHGAALEHGAAHQKDHRQWSRRSFLRDLGLIGSGSMLLANTPITALGASPFSQALSNANTDRILVLIRLKGGNDGLNMIIPISQYGLYQSARPTIRIQEDRVIQLDDRFGMTDSLKPLQSMWDQGAMKVVHSVGYPDQNLSHFRSSDIWASASDSDVEENSGWLGRWLETEFPDFLINPPVDPPAIQIGGSGNLAFLNNEATNMGVVVNNIDQLARIAQDGVLYDPINVPECYYGEQLGYVRSVVNSTFTYAQVINEAYERARNTVEYNRGLGDQFALIARLIKGGLSTRLYMITLGGFDTHAGQNNIHPRLMSELAQGVTDFYQDLASDGADSNVLCMSISEFGRRIEQNASGGTDHGAASPMLLFGAGLNGNGTIGRGPDLADRDLTGNLPYETDFRSIYSSVLENWLCLSPTSVDQIMGNPFDRIPELGIACQTTSYSNPSRSVPLEHTILRNGNQYTLRYYLPVGSRVRAELLDMRGRQLKDLSQGWTTPGWHDIRLDLGQLRLPGGVYLLRMQAGRRALVKKVVTSSL